MEQLYVVWYSKGAGWSPSPSKTKVQAETYALTLQERGYHTRIVQLVHASLDDIVNG